MTNTIKLKRGSGSDPAASDMVVGEPVLRSDTAELFFKKDDGSVAKVSGGGGGGSSFQYLALRNAANDGAVSYPANDFTLVTSGTTTAISPATANALILSYGGVVQKPNSGTSTSGITGFIIDGPRLKTATNFAAAPDFIVYQESGGIGTPSDNTITSAKIVDGAIVNADINASAAIAGSKINPNFVSQEITGGRLSLLDNGSTSPTLLIAGDDGNPWGIQLRNDTYATGGEGLKIFQSNTGITYFQTRGTSARGRLVMQQHNGTTTNNMIEFTEAGAVEIDHAGSKKLETTSTGVTVSNTASLANAVITTSAASDAELEFINTNTSNRTWAIGLDYSNSEAFVVANAAAVGASLSGGEQSIVAKVDGAVELYYDGTKHFDTTSYGSRTTGNHYVTGNFRGDDNSKLDLGSSNDLQIWHQASSHSQIADTTGHQLYLTADNAIYLQSYTGSETYVKCVQNGAVELYWDGTKTFETVQYGVKTGGQLNLYHQSGNSYIKNDSGNLHIGTNGGTYIYGGNDFGEYCAKFLNDGAATLYYDHSPKFETTSGGAKVTGFLNLTTGLHVPDGSSSGDNSIVIGTHNDFRLFHSSANSHIYHNGTGNFFIEAVDANITLRAGNNAGGTHDSIVCTNNAGVKLYYDSGSYPDPKLQTTSTGIGINDDSSGWAEKLQVTADYGPSNQYAIAAKIGSSSGSLMRFATTSSGSFQVCGSITGSGTSTSFNESSDYRLKENEVAISDGITRLKLLKPYRFNWKAETSKTVDGFFAHEVIPAVPEAITGEKDAPVDEKGEGYQQIDYGKLVPLLTAALQEAITKIETLETKVAALEGA